MEWRINHKDELLLDTKVCAILKERRGGTVTTPKFGHSAFYGVYVRDGVLYLAGVDRDLGGGRSHPYFCEIDVWQLKSMVLDPEEAAQEGYLLTAVHHEWADQEVLVKEYAVRNGWHNVV